MDAKPLWIATSEVASKSSGMRYLPCVYGAVMHRVLSYAAIAVVMAVMPIMTVALMCTRTVHAEQASQPHLSGWEAYGELIRGNNRFINSTPKNVQTTTAQRSALARRQHPFAAVLTCSDSRIAPEIVFDQSLGRLFVVRTIGPSLDTTVLASLEFAVAKLGVRLIVVMGHQNCGALREALAPARSLEGDSLPRAVELIRENITGLPSKGSKEGGLQALRVHIGAVASALTIRSKVIREAVKEEDLIIAEALYNLKSGEAQFPRVGRPTVVDERIKKTHDRSKGFPSPAKSPRDF